MASDQATQAAADRQRLALPFCVPLVWMNFRPNALVRSPEVYLTKPLTPTPTLLTGWSLLKSGENYVAQTTAPAS